MAGLSFRILLPLGMAGIGMLLCGALETVSHAQEAKPGDGQPVLPADRLLSTPVGGLEKTRATTDITPVSGQPFARALHVTLHGDAPDTNATQLTMPITAPVKRGD